MRERVRRLVLAINKIDVVYLAGETPGGISDAEYCFMYALDDDKPHSQMEICKEWMIPKTTINTIAKRWEREGMLVFQTVPGKRREMQIELTDKGRLYIRENLYGLYKTEDTAMEKTLSVYGDEFIEAVEAFAENLRTAFEKETE